MQHLAQRDQKTSHFLPKHMHYEENMLPFYAPLPCCKDPPLKAPYLRRQALSLSFLSLFVDPA